MRFNMSHKPILFLSHSSKDRDYLSKLKFQLIEKTGRTFEIFLSSDGQSMPLGKNWVHSVEKALNDSKLMFVFISPNSINSNWIYFESGFAYSKNIKVIPVGINGVDLNRVPAPLSLLQGFNINSEEGLNNLIAIINSEFEFSHKEIFNKQDFHQIHSFLNESSTSNLINDIDYLEFIFSLKKNSNKGSLFERLVKHLEKEGESIGKTYMDDLFLPGMRIQYYPDSYEKEKLIIKIDPYLMEENFKRIIKIYQEIIEDEKSETTFNLVFLNTISAITEDYKILGRLRNTLLNVSKENEDMIECDDLLFKVLKTKGDQIFLNLSCDIKSVNSEKILNLIEILFENQILFDHEYY